MAYRLAGKPQPMSFEPYPTVSLAQAREKREEAKAQLREGLNPTAQRKAQHHALTFQEAIEQYWGGHSDLTAAYRANALRGLEMHVLESLGHQPIHDLTRENLLAVLRVIDAKSRYVYVRKVSM
jgi:hypothetical protein